jgi:hypothetical protein
VILRRTGDAGDGDALVAEELLRGLLGGDHDASWSRSD